MNKNNEKISSIGKIENSHDVVEYLMILMNTCTAKYCHEHKMGIFRKSSQLKHSQSQSQSQSHINEKKLIFDIIKRYNYSACIYELYNENQIFRHEHLNVDCYMHITSPIRRVIDFINMTEIICFQNPNIKENDKIIHFLNSWKSAENIQQINTTFKNIKYIQNESKILDMFYNAEDKDTFLLKEHVGYCIEEEDAQAEVDFIRKLIHIPSLNITTSLKLHKNDPRLIHISLYSKSKYKFFIFKDAYDEKQKLKIDLSVHY